MTTKPATDVVICGAGPTGLALGVWLKKQNVNVRILDKSSEPRPFSRATVVHGRTLELYRQLDLSEELISQGFKAKAMNIWVGGKNCAHVPLGDIGEGLTPYPYILVFPQDAHEHILIRKAESMGLFVERNMEFLGYEEDDSAVTARFKNAAGDEERISTSYFVGCDGAHSKVRKEMGVDFEGAPYPQVCFVADVEGSGPTINTEAHMALDDMDGIVVFPFDGNGHARLLGFIHGNQADQADKDNLPFDELLSEIKARLKMQVDKVNWYATYRVHRRVASNFSKGRVFLAGDAAHIHSPAGGQGMNTGIADAINLAWKLNMAVKGQAGKEVLDSYEAERRGFAQKLVRTTDHVFTTLTGNSIAASILRRRVIPWTMPVAMQFQFAKRFLFRTVSQTAFGYSDGPLAKGSAGYLNAGDRLPWAPDGDEHTENFSTFNGKIEWQVHVYGQIKDAIRQWCDTTGVRLVNHKFGKEHTTAGFVADAAYLIRPDTYIAAIDQKADGVLFDEYRLERGIVNPKL